MEGKMHTLKCLGFLTLSFFTFLIAGTLLGAVFSVLNTQLTWNAIALGIEGAFIGALIGIFYAVYMILRQNDISMNHGYKLLALLLVIQSFVIVVIKLSS